MPKRNQILGLYIIPSRYGFFIIFLNFFLLIFFIWDFGFLFAIFAADMLCTCDLNPVPQLTLDFCSKKIKL